MRIAAAICPRASFEPTLTDALQVEANVAGWSIFCMPMRGAVSAP